MNVSQINRLGRLGTVVVWLSILSIGISGVLAHFVLPTQIYAGFVSAFSEAYYQQEIILATSPIANSTHRILGLAFFIVGMLQFNQPLRSKKPSFHRWCGRAYIVLALVVVVTAAILGLRHAFAGVVEKVSTLIMSAFFCAFVLIGFYHARRKDFRSHRSYMIRGFAVVLSVAIHRPYFVGGLLFLELPDEQLFLLSGAAALTVCVLSAEIWIWLTRRTFRDPVVT